jgi:hypothetical protein
VSDSDDVNFDSVDLRGGEHRRTHWVKKDGTVMLISAMADDHLRNSLRLVERALGCESVDISAPGLVQEWRRRGFEEGSWR